MQGGRGASFEWMLQGNVWLRLGPRELRKIMEQACGDLANGIMVVSERGPCPHCCTVMLILSVNQNAMPGDGAKARALETVLAFLC